MKGVDVYLFPLPSSLLRKNIQSLAGAGRARRARGFRILRTGRAVGTAIASGQTAADSIQSIVQSFVEVACQLLLTGGGAGGHCRRFLRIIGIRDAQDSGLGRRDGINTSHIFSSSDARHLDRARVSPEGPFRRVRIQISKSLFVTINYAISRPDAHRYLFRFFLFPASKGVAPLDDRRNVDREAERAV